MTDLIGALIQELKKIHTYSYTDKVPDLNNVVFPYVILKFDYSVNNRFKELIDMSITIWDRHVDNARIEILTDKIIKALEYYEYKDDKIMAILRFRNRKTIPDIDVEIVRKELTFDCQIFKMRGV
jgi:hypothetical protein